MMMLVVEGGKAIWWTLGAGETFGLWDKSGVRVPQCYAMDKRGYRN